MEPVKPFLCGAKFTVGDVRKTCVRPAHDFDDEGHWVVDRSTPQPAAKPEGEEIGLGIAKAWMNNNGGCFSDMIEDFSEMEADLAEAIDSALLTLKAENARLEAELAEVHNSTIDIQLRYSACIDERDRLTTENDGLREALGEIARDCDSVSRDTSIGLGEKRAWRAIVTLARAALALSESRKGGDRG